MDIGAKDMLCSADLLLLQAGMRDTGWSGSPAARLIFRLTAEMEHEVEGCCADFEAVYFLWTKKGLNPQNILEICKMGSSEDFWGDFRCCNEHSWISSLSFAQAA